MNKINVKYADVYLSDHRVSGVLAIGLDCRMAIYNRSNHSLSEYYQLFHLNILDIDAEIKPGDFFMYHRKLDTEYIQCKDEQHAANIRAARLEGKTFQKIVATTNENLAGPDFPLVHNDFVKAYVKLNGSISELSWEYTTNEKQVYNFYYTIDDIGIDGKTSINAGVAPLTNEEKALAYVKSVRGWDEYDDCFTHAGEAIYLGFLAGIQVGNSNIIH